MVGKSALAVGKSTAGNGNSPRLSCLSYLSYRSYFRFAFLSAGQYQHRRGKRPFAARWRARGSARPRTWLIGRARFGRQIGVGSTVKARQTTLTPLTLFAKPFGCMPRFAREESKGVYCKVLDRANDEQGTADAIYAAHTFCEAIWMRDDAAGKAARGSVLKVHDRATTPRDASIRAKWQSKKKPAGPNNKPHR